MKKLQKYQVFLEGSVICKIVFLTCVIIIVCIPVHLPLLKYLELIDMGDSVVKYGCCMYIYIIYIYIYNIYTVYQCVYMYVHYVHQ